MKSWKIYGHIFSKGFVRCYLEDIKCGRSSTIFPIFSQSSGGDFFFISLSDDLLTHCIKGKSRKSNILTKRWKKLLNVSARSQNVIEIRSGSQKVFFFAKNRLIFNFLCLGIFSNANRLVPKHMFRSQCLFGLSSSLAKVNNEKVSQIMKTQWFLDDRWIVIQFV